jgi:hypothetical protein
MRIVRLVAGRALLVLLTCGVGRIGSVAASARLSQEKTAAEVHKAVVPKNWLILVADEPRSQVSKILGPAKVDQDAPSDPGFSIYMFSPYEKVGIKSVKVSFRDSSHRSDLISYDIPGTLDWQHAMATAGVSTEGLTAAPVVGSPDPSDQGLIEVSGKSLPPHWHLTIRWTKADANINQAETTRITFYNN